MVMEDYIYTAYTVSSIDYMVNSGGPPKGLLKDIHSKTGLIYV